MNIVNTTLTNPTTVDPRSTTILSLSPPYAFSVTSGFGYYNGCDGTGFDCKSMWSSQDDTPSEKWIIAPIVGTTADCSFPFHIVPPPPLEVDCSADNVSSTITPFQFVF